jgi:hypothetical protein
MTITTELAEAIAELDLYDDTDEAREARALVALLVDAARSIRVWSGQETEPLQDRTVAVID